MKLVQGELKIKRSHNEREYTDCTAKEKIQMSQQKTTRRFDSKRQHADLTAKENIQI